MDHPRADSPLPRANCCPKSLRMNTHFPKTWWLRTSHGPTTAKKIREAITTPRIDFTPRLCRRYQAQSPEIGRKEIVEGFVSATNPQSMPKSVQPPIPSQSSSSSVTKKIMASRNGEMVVSQTQ